MAEGYGDSSTAGSEDALGKPPGVAWNSLTVGALQAGGATKRGRGSRPLLDHVSEFVGKQAPAGSGSGRILSTRKDDIGTHRVGPGSNGRSGLGSEFICMHAHVAKVASETRLHKSTGCSVERLTGGQQDFVDDGRRFGAA
jgi:hypothetical protein